MVSSFDDIGTTESRLRLSYLKEKSIIPTNALNVSSSAASIDRCHGGVLHDSVLADADEIPVPVFPGRMQPRCRCDVEEGGDPVAFDRRNVETPPRARTDL